MNRRERPFVAVNMGAIPPSLAAAELFGAEKGAFTGANRARRGFFRSADGGTLFLDEIGETPSEVQGMLLRVLETGEIQPVGSENPRKVNVRVLAATDARLEMEIAEGRFRAPLLHRLNGFEIRLPPLRERLDDLGRLLLHFLRQEMENLGENFSLVASGNPRGPWLPAPLVAQLAMGHWPGNVRQLLNITRQLVIGNRGAQQLRLTPEIAAQLEQFPAQGDSESSRTSPDDLQADVIAPSATSQEVVKPLVLRDSMDRSSLKESLGDRRALLVMSEQDQKVRRLMAEYGGHEIDKTDGLLLLFDRPADALGFALSYQEPAGGQPPGPEPSAPSPVESKPSYRRPGEVSEQELLAALKAYGFRLQPTAAALNISRTSLYALIKKSPHVRKARDLTQEEITQALERCRGDLEATAAELEVSRKGLRRRMTELGFK